MEHVKRGSIKTSYHLKEVLQIQLVRHLLQAPSVVCRFAVSWFRVAATTSGQLAHRGTVERRSLKHRRLVRLQFRAKNDLIIAAISHSAHSSADNKLRKLQKGVVVLKLDVEFSS